MSVKVEAEYDPEYLVLIPRHPTPQMLEPWSEGSPERFVAIAAWETMIMAWDKTQEDAIALHERLEKESK